ncbi:hypothetical protein BAUCODRAFT_530159 [Baudoinia panamericana UAMH 10762]|uniref:Uncharacterized protein n=1 Tax=Baudoinia panamericana (strain UAMH 10762) TaxID=717646 RepID=M2MEZ6_BAUPA|nr:uncharacterized protein BAUCODRAFT_530159 [Baudoinia panamericana UAMH 10762]EMC95181.1 hypothetical protein BAUCODRAFT_530159 [Baudoinia panamericana UAMH 10762]
MQTVEYDSNVGNSPTVSQRSLPYHVLQEQAKRPMLQRAKTDEGSPYERKPVEQEKFDPSAQHFRLMFWGPGPSNRYMSGSGHLGGVTHNGSSQQQSQESSPQTDGSAPVGPPAASSPSVWRSNEAEDVAATQSDDAREKRTVQRPNHRHFTQCISRHRPANERELQIISNRRNSELSPDVCESLVDYVRRMCKLTSFQSLGPMTVDDMRSRWYRLEGCLRPCHGESPDDYISRMKTYSEAIAAAEIAVNIPLQSIQDSHQRYKLYEGNLRPFAGESLKEYVRRKLEPLKRQDELDVGTVDATLADAQERWWAYEQRGGMPPAEKPCKY